jgi:hypothetical protein
MAYYSPIDDKIIGAEPGSLAYRHEEGHRRHRRLGLFFCWISPHLLIIAIGALAYDIKIMAQLSFWFWIFLVVLDETLAWAYAF